MFQKLSAFAVYDSYVWLTHFVWDSCSTPPINKKLKNETAAPVFSSNNKRIMSERKEVKNDDNEKEKKEGKQYESFLFLLVLLLLLRSWHADL